MDATGLFPLRQFAHVRIRNRNHRHFGETGTVVRTDPNARKVWVALPTGKVCCAGNRSVEVLAPRRADRA